VHRKDLMIPSYVCFFLAITTLWQGDIASFERNESHQNLVETIHIHQGTHLTFRRYYFISRLDRTMQLLLKIQSANRISFDCTVRAINFDMSLFNDKRVIRSLKRIQETRSLKPLFMIWDDFIAYKSLEDDVFIEDFSKEIFIVTRTVLSSLDERNIDLDNIWLGQIPQEPPNKTEQLLDAIDEITHALQKVVPDNTPFFKSHHIPPLDLKSEVSSDEIALRFYYVQRLQKAMDILSKIQKPIAYTIFNSITTSRSAHIQSLLRAMQESGNNNAIHQTWNDVKEYKYIDSVVFVKEFACVIFIALRHLYTGGASPELMSSESSIEKMHIEEILHAIDIITDQLSQSTQISNGYMSETFEEWIQHYWWIPPLTLGCITIRLAYYYYGPKHSLFGFGYGSHGSSYGFNHGLQQGSSDLMF
jgi:hypothetical protein